MKNEFNPYVHQRSKFFTLFSDGGNSSCAFDGSIIATDATLGVPGLPQSATGQTTILTGVNASNTMGRHVAGFPTPTLRRILAEHSIFLQLKKARRTSTFANGYTPQYFDRSQQFWSATTWAVKAADIPLRWLEDIRSGNAIAPDFTNDFLVTRGIDIPVRTADASGKIVAKLLQENDFVLCEHPFSDGFGHSQNMELAIADIKKTDEFLEGILSSVHRDAHTILLTSDHGNMEDLRTGTHTMNRVPTIVWGKNKEFFERKITSLLALTPAIVRSFENHSNARV